MLNHYPTGAEEELRQEDGRGGEGEGGDAEEDQAGVRREAAAEGDRGHAEGEGNRGQNQVRSRMHGIGLVFRDGKMGCLLQIGHP